MCKENLKCVICENVLDLNNLWKSEDRHEGVKLCCHACSVEGSGVKFNDYKTLSIVCAFNKSLEYNDYWVFRRNCQKEYYVLSDYAIMPQLYWLDRCRRVRITYRDCLNARSKCSDLKDYRDDYNSLYQTCFKRGWQDILMYIPRAPRRGGYSLKTFIKNCNKNNKGRGTLYLIKCTGNGESFYKIGITSNTITKRYTKKQDMPYDYEIIWEFKSDPKEIWDLEHLSHRKTKPYRYQPDLWPNKALETFKCHGNCKVLRKPT